MSEPSPHSPAVVLPPRRLWRRLNGVAVLLVALVTLAAVLLGALDRPIIKQQVQRLVRRETGLSVDYRATRFRLLSGLRVSGIRIASPAPFDAVAPDLARVGTLELTWSLGSLFGRGPAIEGIAVHDLAVTVVTQGEKSSPGALLEEKRPSPVESPSQKLAEALRTGLPARHITVDGIALTLDRLPEAATFTRSAAQLDRWRLEGLGLTAQMQRRGGARTVQITTGNGPAELHLIFEHAGAPPADARARLAFEATARAGAARVRLGLRLVRQTFDGQLPALDRVLSADAEVRALPGAGRIELELHSLAALDGAASTTARLTLSDSQPAIVDSLDGSIDLARILTALPAAWRPLSLRTGRLSYRARALALGARREGLLGAAGSFHVDGTLDGVRVQAAAGELALDGARLALDGRADKGQAIAGTLALGFARLSAEQPGVALRAESGKLTLDCRRLHVDAAQPLHSRGAVTLKGGLASLAVVGRGWAARQRGLALALASELDGRPPYRLSVELPVAGFTLTGPNGRVLVSDTPGRVSAHLLGVVPDGAQPLASRGQLHAEIDLGGVKLVADGDKRADDADFQVALDGPRLGLVAALLGPRALGGFRAPWERMGIALRSHGQVSRIRSGAPRITEASTLTLTHAALRGRGRDVATSRLQLTEASEGTVAAGQARFALAIGGLRLGTRTIGDGQLHGSIDLDSSRPRLRLDLTGSGAAGPNGTLTLSADFDRGRRALRYRADAAFSRLALVGALLPASLHPVSFNKLRLEAHADGELRGVVVGFHRGRPRFAADPLIAARGSGHSSLEVDGLRYTGGDGMVVVVPRWEAHAAFDADAQRRTVDVEMQLPRLHATIGGDQIETEDLNPTVNLAITGDPLVGRGTLRLHATAKSIRDSGFQLYPIGGLELDARLSRSPEGDVRIESLALDNPQGGTHLALTGGLDLTTTGQAVAAAAGSLAERLIAGRRSLSITGTLEQRLDALDGGALRVSAAGQLGLTFEVQSADLRLFHTSGSLAIDGARLAFGDGLTIDGVDARLPLTEDLVLDDRGGVHRLGGADADAYSQLRFVDQHPFFSKPSFLSVRRIKDAGFELGPLAGNARVDRNLVTLDQVELLANGGKVTGQCAIDLGAQRTIELRAAATGLREKGSTNGERLDANAALMLSLRNRALNGRIELVRVGRGQLLDLLNLYDPYHADVAANRVRLALKVGYPKSARLHFEDGFASLAITLGGLAKWVRIDELLGIPTGPLVEKFLGPLLPKGTP